MPLPRTLRNLKAADLERQQARDICPRTVRVALVEGELNCEEEHGEERTPRAEERRG